MSADQSTLSILKNLMVKSMIEIKNKCGEIKKAIPGEYSWAFDARFNAALVILDRESAEALKGDLTAILGEGYDVTSIKKAPDSVKKLAKEIDLKKNQALYADNFQEKILFCAWWPWGDNSKISLRVGIYNHDSDETAAILKECFGMR